MISLNLNNSLYSLQEIKLQSKLRRFLGCRLSLRFGMRDDAADETRFPKRWYILWTFSFFNVNKFTVKTLVLNHTRLDSIRVQSEMVPI